MFTSRDPVKKAWLPMPVTPASAGGTRRTPRSSLTSLTCLKRNAIAQQLKPLAAQPVDRGLIPRNHAEGLIAPTPAGFLTSILMPCTCTATAI